VGAYREDWCSHLLNKLVSIRLVSIDCKWVLTLRIDVLVFSTGWCLSIQFLKSCKWVINAGIGVPHRLNHVQNVIIV
jgi:hypothetical protein